MYNFIRNTVLSKVRIQMSSKYKKKTFTKTILIWSKNVSNKTETKQMSVSQKPFRNLSQFDLGKFWKFCKLVSLNDFNWISISWAVHLLWFVGFLVSQISFTQIIIKKKNCLSWFLAECNKLIISLYVWIHNYNSLLFYLHRAEYCRQLYKWLYYSCVHNLVFFPIIFMCRSNDKIPYHSVEHRTYCKRQNEKS